VHSNSMENSWKSDKDGTVLKKPSCSVAYNHSMGGVDLMDQQLDSLLVLRKSYKWYKKLLLRLILQGKKARQPIQTNRAQSLPRQTPL